MAHATWWTLLALSVVPLVDGLWPQHWDAADRLDLLPAVAGAQYVDSFAMSCRGAAGRRVLAAELVAVAAAGLLTVLGPVAIRRVSLAALAGWAGLWTYNAAHVAAQTHTWGFVVAAEAAALLLALTLVRLALTRSRKRGAASANRGAPALAQGADSRRLGEWAATCCGSPLSLAAPLWPVAILRSRCKGAAGGRVVRGLRRAS
jgi:uncharacterized membrane protein (UPF0136 family)